MLGWHISVYRKTDDGGSPAEWESPKGTRLAVWQTGLGGLDWLRELVKAGKAIDLGGDGYPLRYTATAEDLIPHLAEEGLTVWMLDPGDVVGEGWEGRTVIDKATVRACRPDEWLLVEAWDES